MNNNTVKFSGLRDLAAAVAIATLAACGGGGGSSDDDSSSSSSPIVARGAITQLGSIYVNGVKYETPSSSSYFSDDNTVGANAFKVGQVVSLRGRRNDDGVTGTASEVAYEAEIEGEAQGGAINNVTIVLTPKTNTSDIPGFGGTLQNGTRYEVSGLWIDNNTIEATYLKEDDDGDGFDELKGFVDSVGANSFDVRGITFTGYTGVPALSAGDFVEVHFTGCAGNPLSCTLTSVELEDDFFDQAEGLEIEIEGAVDLDTTGCPAQAEFKVDGVCIDSDSKPAQWLDGLASIDDLVQGSRVEAEGHMVAGAPRDYLRADKVKGRGNRVRVTSIATGVNAGAGSFQLVEGNIDVSTMSGVTEFEDGLTINTLDSGAALNGIEVRGVRTGPNSLLAIRIKLEGLSGGGDRHEIRAEVDDNGTSTANNTLTVMGIVSMANASTELEIEDVVVAPGNGLTTNTDIDGFLMTIDADTDPTNGPRDVVEAGVDVGTGDGSPGSPYLADEWEIEEEDD